MIKIPGMERYLIKESDFLMLLQDIGQSLLLEPTITAE